jgi:hypothetical protein
MFYQQEYPWLRDTSRGIQQWLKDKYALVSPLSRTSRCRVGIFRGTASVGPEKSLSLPGDADYEEHQVPCTTYSAAVLLYTVSGRWTLSWSVAARARISAGTATGDAPSEIMAIQSWGFQPAMESE